MMEEEAGLPDDHPSQLKFRMLALDTNASTHQLLALTAHYNADRRRYAHELAMNNDLRNELAYEESRLTGNDYDESERRQRVAVLTEQIAELITPEPPNEALYRVQRSMLEMKLRESAQVATSMLVWHAQSEQN